MKTISTVLSSAALVAATLVLGAAPAQAAENSLETSDVVACGQITISLRNVSPWIYPVSVYIDDQPRVFGPVVDNRTDGGLSGPQKDVTASRTYTFPEDSGTHTVRYVVEAGTESDLYDGLPVGESTTRTVESDCQPPNSLETSDVVRCGAIDISLRNVSPWIYPVSVYIDDQPRVFGPVVDNRTDGGLSGPQKDATATSTYTFDEDSGTHTVRYVVEAGTESDLYDGLPVGESTTRTVESDCQPDGTDAGGDGDTGDVADADVSDAPGADGDVAPAAAVLPDTGASAPWWQAWTAVVAVVLGAALIAVARPRRPRGRHAVS